jgi:hypothetical protein
MNLFAKKSTLAAAWGSIAGATSLGFFVGLATPAHAYIPAYTVPSASGASYPGTNPSSWGLFFDTKANMLMDGLGFSSQPGWPTGSTQYTVTLWSFDNFGTDPSDYTEVASKTFIPGVSYTFQDNYFWQDLGPIPLANTGPSVDPFNRKGYVIAAIGDFSAGPGNVQYESGVPTISPNFLLGGNGYNDSSQPALPVGYYPVPIFDGGVGINGYFNPNLSYVPGPLPILGVATGLGVARRIRRRVKSAS